MSKQRFPVLLEAKQLAALRANEATTGAPVGAQIRLAIDVWLAAAKPTSKKKRTRA